MLVNKGAALGQGMGVRADTLDILKPGAGHGGKTVADFFDVRTVD